MSPAVQFSDALSCEHEFMIVCLASREPHRPLKIEDQPGCGPSACLPLERSPPNDYKMGAQPHSGDDDRQHLSVDFRLKRDPEVKFMQSDTQNAPISKQRLWAGRMVSALPALFLLVDGAMKLAKPAPVVGATVRLGYPESVIYGLGIVLVTCTILYVIPRTSVLGAILLTGYLGGATATHVRVGCLVLCRLSGHAWDADLGRALATRPAVARAHSSAKVA